MANMCSLLASYSLVRTVRKRSVSMSSGVCGENEDGSRIDGMSILGNEETHELTSEAGLRDTRKGEGLHFVGTHAVEDLDWRVVGFPLAPFRVCPQPCKGRLPRPGVVARAQARCRADAPAVQVAHLIQHQGDEGAHDDGHAPPSREGWQLVAEALPAAAAWTDGQDGGR